MTRFADANANGEQKSGDAMDKWFVILFGVLVASLYVPPIVIPARHREYARRVATQRFMRRFSVVPAALGVVAILLSNNSDLHHRLVFVLGVIEIVTGAYLLVFPAHAVSQVEFLCSKSLKVWIARGVLKFGLGLIFITWGVFCF